MFIGGIYIYIYMYIYIHSTLHPSVFSDFNQIPISVQFSKAMGDACLQVNSRTIEHGHRRSRLTHEKMVTFPLSVCQRVDPHSFRLHKAKTLPSSRLAARPVHLARGFRHYGRSTSENSIEYL